ncbi:hypothetical protein [Streptomyces sp. NRRL B-24484]|uniref:hypothetical protein n=1 Tax=Streptomyces sp. NRRL B-24484 TaxID=1463833 RepID=UPI0004C0FCB1|nr:hypothetical protein [Streptomyces sp. NRRL B-24484]
MNRAVSRLAVGGAAAVLVTAGILFTHDEPSPPATPTVPAGAARPAATATPTMSVTRLSGTSRISTTESAGAILRGCPAAIPTQQDLQDTNVQCAPVERLATGTTVQMRCWHDVTGRYARPAPEHSTLGADTQGRWFYVTELDGEHPQTSGFLYSDVIPVPEQIRTPGCSDEIYRQYPVHPRAEPAHPTLTVDGTCTTDGGTLVGRTSGFAEGVEYYIDAAYPDGRPYPVKSATKGRADGTVAWTWPCKGDPAGTYTTSIGSMDGSVSTGTVSFTIGAAAAAPQTRTTTPPPAPAAAPADTPAPAGPASPQPVHVTVFDQVTNGATQLREDTPAYLSTRTVARCRLFNCKVDGTDMHSGAGLDALCQLQGDRITNGEDNNAIDDRNPGLFTSTRWYKARSADGREGYISEVWLGSGDRGGRGLPTC